MKWIILFFTHLAHSRNTDSQVRSAPGLQDLCGPSLSANEQVSILGWLCIHHFVNLDY